jgi:NAD(P)-dependent dehydrogenase (short-subunit alcohol dehydrogenase family)
VIPELAVELASELAVITEASWGIGQALALALAKKGVRVAGLSRAPYAAEAAGITPFVADVRDPEDVTRAFGEIRTRLGTPTILINNSETYPDRDILDETPGSFMDTVRLNLGGAFNCCHAVLPDMVASGRGRIINVVTFADVHPMPLSAGYSVSKGALRIFTRSLVADLGDRFPGIVVNDWVPGTHQPRKGIPDGVDPLIAAEWGARLALMKSPDINGLVFLRDHEHAPPRSFKGRVRDRVMGRRRSQLKLG